MAKAQPQSDSPDAEAALDAASDRPNAATRAIAYSESPCCETGTELVELEKAKRRFSLELRKRVEQIDHTGEEVVAVCRDCRNAVGVVCR